MRGSRRRHLSVPGRRFRGRSQFREAFVRYGSQRARFPVRRVDVSARDARTSDADARDMVIRTLRSMALGGMRDHVGGGFHRYSVDAGWRVPHFEKMLYDQAQLALAYLEGAQVSGEAFYAEVAEDTLLYVLRQMTDEAGGFYSAEDADSVPPEHSADGDAHWPHVIGAGEQRRLNSLKRRAAGSEWIAEQSTFALFSYQQIIAELLR